MKILLLSVAITVFAISGISAICQGSTSMRDPWTYEARTFNPAGVKYTGGVTTGREISSRAPAAWAGQAQAELLKELER